MRLTARPLTMPRLRAGKDRRPNPIAVSPLCWGISDSRGWGAQLEPERVLGEVASLGETSVEAGPSGFLPDRSEAARSMLRRHRLRLVAGPVRAVLHHHELRGSELAHIDGHAGWLAALGAQTLVLTLIASRGDEAHIGELSSTGWAHLLSSIGTVQHVCTVHKLQLAVEPGQGSMIQGPQDIERLLVGAEAGVCIDLAQLVLAGADPLEVIELAAGRIHHVHVNDIDSNLARQVREDGLEYAGAVSAGLFKPLGTGDADVAGAIDALGRAGYAGWYGLETDRRLGSVEDDPVAEVKASLERLRTLLPAVKGKA